MHTFRATLRWKEIKMKYELTLTDGRCNWDGENMNCETISFYRVGGMPIGYGANIVNIPHKGSAEATLGGLQNEVNTSNRALPLL